MTNPLLHGDRASRWLHPVAWWMWALGAAVVASSSTNPLVLVGVSGSALLVVVTRGARAPWAAPIGVMLRVAALVIVLRIVMQGVLGAAVGVHVVLHVPEVSLPAWLTGIRLGGPVTLESVLLGCVEGMRFAAILLCIAAATTVAAPSRLFRGLPARAADLGTVLIVAMTLVPHLVADFQRIGTARRLRGRRTRGARAVAQTLVPVIDGAMERSMQLAASMFSRGYGCAPTRTHHRPDPWRRVETMVAASAVVAAMLATAVLSRDAGATLSIAPLQWPTLPLSAAVCIVLLALPSTITPRTPVTDGGGV